MKREERHYLLLAHLAVQHKTLKLALLHFLIYDTNNINKERIPGIIESLQSII